MVQLTLLYAALSLMLYSSTATPRSNGTEINLPLPRHGISGWRLSLQRPYQVSENTLRRRNHCLCGPISKAGRAFC